MQALRCFNLLLPLSIYIVLKIKIAIMRKILRSAFLPLGLLMFCLPGFAQQRSINGTVTSSDNVGLPGVTISIKGTNKATQTDASGRYSIAAEKGQTLQSTYIGFQ